MSVNVTSHSWVKGKGAYALKKKLCVMENNILSKWKPKASKRNYSDKIDFTPKVEDKESHCILLKKPSVKKYDY